MVSLTRLSTVAVLLLAAGCPATEPAVKPAPPPTPPPARAPAPTPDSEPAPTVQINVGEILTGKVVSVADGDTITFLVNETQHRIRLHGIDCPEGGQPFGTKAKQFTSELAFGQTVTARVVDTDRYGRLVCRVTLPDGKDLSAELVRAGLAWWYQRYAPDDKELAKLEIEAREAKRGLWADPKPVPPWEWRKVRRERHGRSDYGSAGAQSYGCCSNLGIAHTGIVGLMLAPGGT